MSEQNTTPEYEPSAWPSCIDEALLWFRRACPYVQQTGELPVGNKGAKANVMTYQDVAMTCNPWLIRYGLSLETASHPDRPINLTEYTTTSGSVMQRAEVPVLAQLCFWAPKSIREVRSYEFVGVAADTGDKAVNKAYTVSRRLAYQHILGLAWGADDPAETSSQLQEKAGVGGPSGLSPYAEKAIAKISQAYESWRKGDLQFAASELERIYRYVREVIAGEKHNAGLSPIDEDAILDRARTIGLTIGIGKRLSAIDAEFDRQLVQEGSDGETQERNRE